jgi:hypothetical protein
MQTRILGDLDESLLIGALCSCPRLPPMLDASGRVPARRLVRENPQTLILTSSDLAVPGCNSAFGFADRRRQAAVVSTARLGGPGSPARERLAKVIAHERGHLRGLSHCRAQGCVMRPARTVEDLDTRGLAPCGCCPRPFFKVLGVLSAIAACLILFAGLDAAASLMKVNFLPFSWRSQGESASLLYKRQPVLTLRANGGVSPETRMHGLSQSLNELFRQVSPPAMQVVSSASGRASIFADGQSLVEILPQDTGGMDPAQYARAWTQQMAPLMRGKGTEADGCPDCHIRRIDEIQEAIRNKGKNRR